jgi:peroxin-5
MCLSNFSLYCYTQAESAWGYLRISLGCCGRIELMEAVDNKDLETLQKHFPL